MSINIDDLKQMEINKNIDGEKKEVPDSNENNSNKISLLLGDVIKIFSSTNSVLNDKNFYINYIDHNKLSLINIDTNAKETLFINTAVIKMVMKKI